MPASMSLERRQLLQSYGAELVLTPEEQQMEGAIAKGPRDRGETPLSFMPQQFENSANPDVHFRATSQEILHALAGEPVHAFVAAVGTGGTISGVGRALRERYPECRVIAVEPESCATISRGERGPSKIQGIAAGFVPRTTIRALSPKCAPSRTSSPTKPRSIWPAARACWPASARAQMSRWRSRLRASWARARTW